MQHFADDIVSYEHDTPLQYVGRDQVQEVCRQGLDWAPVALTWDVPDMRVLIRGDIAVVWGLNHMTAGEADGTTTESWSRGTRVLQRRNGKWAMIHDGGRQTSTGRVGVSGLASSCPDRDAPTRTVALMQPRKPSLAFEVPQRMFREGRLGVVPVGPVGSGDVAQVGEGHLLDEGDTVGFLVRGFR